MLIAQQLESYWSHSIQSNNEDTKNSLHGKAYEWERQKRNSMLFRFNVVRMPEKFISKILQFKAIFYFDFLAHIVETTNENVDFVRSCFCCKKVQKLMTILNCDLRKEREKTWEWLRLINANELEHNAVYLVLCFIFCW